MPAYAAIKRLLESLAYHPPAEEEHPDDADGGSYHCQAPGQPVSPGPLFSARWKAVRARWRRAPSGERVLVPTRALKAVKRETNCFALRVACCGGGGTPMQTCVGSLPCHLSV